MRIDRRVRQFLLCLGLAALSGCAATPTHRPYAHRDAHPPGPPGDPWGPYIHEAATRFRVPEKWIRAVMRQESGGQAHLTSSAGAIGLMQVMPATYAELAARYGLGPDPFDPHDNMMAGVGYLRQMYDRYGSPHFLAAYNAGPGRVDAYRAGAASLPDETVNYVASITPYLGNESAPVATTSYAPPRYETASQPMVASMASTSSLGTRVLVNAPPCDADAAYDPTRTCRNGPAPLVAADAPPCDPDAAYDPRQVCRPMLTPPDLPPASAPSVTQMTAADIKPAIPPMRQPPARSPLALAQPAGHWAVELGIFPQIQLARNVATAARGNVPNLLGNAPIALPPTTPFGGLVLYRARVTALSLTAAHDACAKLLPAGFSCVIISPDQES